MSSFIAIYFILNKVLLKRFNLRRQELIDIYKVKLFYFFLRQGLQVNLELVVLDRPVGQQATGVCLSLPTPALDYRHAPPHSTLIWMLEIRTHVLMLDQ